MTTITARDARQNLSEYVSRAAFGKERLLITRNRKKVAALVPVEDVELLEALEDLIDIEEARRALVEAEEKGTISFEELKAELRG